MDEFPIKGITYLSDIVGIAAHTFYRPSDDHIRTLFTEHRS